jgi:hypothetical protein
MIAVIVVVFSSLLVFYVHLSIYADRDKAENHDRFSFEATEKD